MPYNGTGTFVRVYNWVTDAANGILVRADRMDTETDGIATALSNCITRDGQGIPTANIPFGGYQIKNLAAGSLPTDAVNYAQAFTSPTWSNPTGTGVVTFSGATSVTVPTAAPGTNSTIAASTAFATALAFSAALPAQPGTAVRYNLTTLSGVASWTLTQMTRSARTANTILGLTDSGTFIDVTSGTFTQTFTAAATLGAGWVVRYRNSGSGDITIPSSDGVTNWIMYPGECRDFFCDGTGFYSEIVTAYFKKYTAGGVNWVKPPGYLAHSGIAWSAGGSGEKSAAATQAAGGFGGGAWPFTLDASTLAATQLVTIGAGGTAVSAASTVGVAGGSTTFATVTVTGGSGGNAAAGSSGRISGLSTTASQANGFEGTTTGGSAVWGGAGNSAVATTSAAGNSIYGGGGGGSINSGITLNVAGTSTFAGAGGAASLGGNGTAGTAPAGGGGATGTGGSSGAGGRGELWIWGIA